MLGAETLDDSLSSLKDMLKLDQAAYDALLADLKQVAKLQDGNSAMALYPDGQAALGAMAVAQLVSAMLRGRLNESRELVDDSVFGGFRASITYSALFTAAFVIDRFTGPTKPH